MLPQGTLLGRAKAVVIADELHDVADEDPRMGIERADAPDLPAAFVVLLQEFVGEPEYISLRPTCRC